MKYLCSTVTHVFFLGKVISADFFLEALLFKPALLRLEVQH